MTFTARQLDMKPPGSILDWRIFDDGFIGGDYRIVHLGPRNWLVTRRNSIVGTYRRLKTAFVSAERHHRRMLRVERVKKTAFNVAVVAALWFLLVGVLGWTAPGAWLLFPVTLLGMTSVLKLVAREAGNPTTT